MSQREARDEALSWTELGVRMGYTSEAAQRAEILTARTRMYWTDPGTRPPWLHAPVVQAIVQALLRRRRNHLHRVGVAQLNGGRQLIGLQDTRGTCRYLLDLHTEAIHVLTEACAADETRRSRVA